MARIIDSLIDNNGVIRCMSAQDYANLTTKEKDEIQAMLKDKGESLEEYEARIKKLFPPEITMPPIHWID